MNVIIRFICMLALFSVMSNVALATPGNSLASGEYLATNQYIVSANQRYFAIMQGDGNLVVYAGSWPGDNRGLVWQTGTAAANGNPSFAIMQGDGNFIVYRGSDPGHNTGTIAWNTRTDAIIPDQSPTLRLTDDGALIIIVNNCKYFQNTPLQTYTSSNCVPVVADPYQVSEFQNVAQGKPATQSSTGYGGDPSRATDGNTSGNWGDNSTTHTNLDNQAWWQVDLKGSFNITEVTLFNRTDCCTDRLSNFHVDLLDQSGNVVATQLYSGIVAGEVTLRFSGYRANFVRVQLVGTNYLSLAEVVVRSDASAPIYVENLALDKPTYQSSVDSNGISARAVDGNASGNWSNASVSATANEYQPWWAVWLGEANDVTEVTIYNRTDCCTDRLSNFHVDLITGQILSPNEKVERRIDYSGTVNGQITFKFPRTKADFVRIQLNGTNILSLAEVVVRNNLALGLPTSQSSTINGGDSSRAVDGNTSGNWASSSVTHTDQQANAWWKVNLQQPQNIGEVVIWNRTDCCSDRLSNYIVELLDANGTMVSKIPVSATGVKTSVDFAGATGQSVRVTLNGTNYLSLAEVEVFPSSAYSAMSEQELINSTNIDHDLLGNQLIKDGEKIRLLSMNDELYLSCLAGKLIAANALTTATTSKACEFTVEKTANTFALKTPNGYLVLDGSGNFLSNGTSSNAVHFTARTNSVGNLSFILPNGDFLVIIDNLHRNLTTGNSSTSNGNQGWFTTEIKKPLPNIPTSIFSDCEIAKGELMFHVTVGVMLAADSIPVILDKHVTSQFLTIIGQSPFMVEKMGEAVARIRQNPSTGVKEGYLFLGLAYQQGMLGDLIKLAATEAGWEGLAQLIKKGVEMAIPGAEEVDLGASVAVWSAQLGILLNNLAQGGCAS